MAGIEKIYSDIEKHQTSLGDNPALPPDDGATLRKIVETYYNALGSNSINETELGRTLNECMKEEIRSQVMLEELAATFLQRLFDTDTFEGIEIDLKLVEYVDSKNERMYPEAMDDFSFEDIDDMNRLTGEIYKRRMLNVLVTGAAHYYGMQVDDYTPEVRKINNNLIPLYDRIITNNDKFLYEKATQGPSENDDADGGKVDVTITPGDGGIQIKAEGLIYPVLVMEAIKGLLELVIAHGLPENRDKAMYILSKADFRYAEFWDQRLGFAIWEWIESIASNNSINIDNKLQYFFMELSKMPVENFNKFISNLLAKTNYGITHLKELCNKIENDKERDDFDSHIGGLEANRPIDGNGYYDSKNADKLLIGDAVIQ